MDWTEVPGSEDIENIGTRKQFFLTMKLSKDTAG